MRGKALCRMIGLFGACVCSAFTISCTSPGGDSGDGTGGVSIEGVWFVDAAASGSGNGTTWENAFQHPQHGVDAASRDEQVWVAGGVYTSLQPDTGSVPVVALKQGVSLYGGFRGSETSLDQRDVSLHETILDGQESVYRVVIGAGDARLDGFTVRRGKAYALGGVHYGNGMYNVNCPETLVVARCTFENNMASSTGGIFYNKNSSPLVTDCVFRNNLTGDMLNDNSSPRVTGCVFEGNSVYAMHNQNASSPEVSNCLFTGAPTGMNNSQGSSPLVSGCTFTGHTRMAMSNNESAPLITECLFAFNTSGPYCAGVYNLRSDAQISLCAFLGNSSEDGPGAVLNSGTCSPVIDHCLFTANTTNTDLGNGGGAVRNIVGSTPKITNCLLVDNRSLRTGGAGISSYKASPYIESCLFVGNRGMERGGAVWNDESSPAVINCTFSMNQAGWSGAALYNESGSNPTIANCILWGNVDGAGDPSEIDDYESSPAVTYSDLHQSGYAGSGGNISADPLFRTPLGGNWTADPVYDQESFTTTYQDGGLSLEADQLQGMVLQPDDGSIRMFPIVSNTGSSVTALGDGTGFVLSGEAYLIHDFRLQGGSPCIDSANGHLAPELDLPGLPRYDDPGTANTGAGAPADMGACEYQGE